MGKTFSPSRVCRKGLLSFHHAHQSPRGAIWQNVQNLSPSPIPPSEPTFFSSLQGAGCSPRWVKGSVETLVSSCNLLLPASSASLSILGDTNQTGQLKQKNVS